MPTAATRLRSALAVAATAAAVGLVRAEEAAERKLETAPPKRQCYSMAQTREKIEAHKLVDPFDRMRAAARELNGEALGAKLCRHDEILVYEISVLRPDGHIVRRLFDATTGKPHGGGREKSESEK